MVLTSRERQARYLARLKERAGVLSDAAAPRLITLLTAYFAEPGRLAEWDYKEGVTPEAAAKSAHAEILGARQSPLIDGFAEDTTPAAVALTAFLARLKT